MTAAEILRNAEPPADDGLIDKAIAELDVRIWEWADALKSAHTQLRGAFATKPARPSASLFDDVPAGTSAFSAAAPAALSAAAAAAHIPSPPPMPAEWTAPPSSTGLTSAPGMPAEAPPAWGATQGGHGASSGRSQAAQPAWPEPAPSRQSDGGGGGPGGVMAWPSSPSSANAWPSSSGSQPGGAQEWPTWTPTDTSQPAPSRKTQTQAPLTKKQKMAARPMPEGPSPEERAQKAAAEEALLSELEDAIARRVRLLRRLDPDTPIEKLIDKAKQGQAESASGPQAKEDKSSSWWRRK